MKHHIKDNGQFSPSIIGDGIGERSASEAEIEFWAEIQRLRGALGEIAEQLDAADIVTNETIEIEKIAAAALEEQ